jgi:hypothetical protein
MTVNRALIIASPYIERILTGAKTWEMRSTATKLRGRIGLVRKGSGLIVATANLVDSIGPLSQDQMLAHTDRHLIESERIMSGAVDKWKFAWVLKGLQVLHRPVPYTHPPGAVIWVALDEQVQSALTEAA